MWKTEKPTLLLSEHSRLFKLCTFRSPVNVNVHISFSVFASKCLEMCAAQPPLIVPCTYLYGIWLGLKIKYNPFTRGTRPGPGRRGRVAGVIGGATGETREETAAA